MLNISTALFTILILSFSFLEVIVFNEEVFLAACFIIFLFVGYSHSSILLSSILFERSKTFGLGLFSSFILHFDISYKNFQDNLFSNYMPKISGFGCFWWLLSVRVYEYNFFLNRCFTELFFVAPNNLLVLHFRTETKIFLFAQAYRSQTTLITLHKVFEKNPFSFNRRFAVIPSNGIV